MLTFNIMAIMPFLCSLFWLAIYLLEFRNSDEPRRYFIWFIIACTGFQLARMFRLTICPDQLITPCHLISRSLYIFFGLALYPTAFLYINALTSEKDSRHRFRLSILLFLAVDLLIVAVFILAREADWIRYFTFIMLIAEILLFSGYGYSSIHRYRNNLYNFYSDTEGMKLTSLVNVFYIFLTISVIKSLFLALGRNLASNIISVSVLSVSFTVILFIICYNVSKRSFSIQDYEQDVNKSVQQPHKDQERANATRQEIARQILEVMDKKKLYLKPSLSIVDVAMEVGTNRTYISDSINTVLNQSFNDFINSMRVEEAKRLLNTGKYGAGNLADLALECGFSSESAFYRNFRKFCGTSPAKMGAPTVTH